MSKTLTNEEFIKKFYQCEKSEEYEILSPYINNKSNIKLKHKKCGKIYNVRAGNFLYLNYRCNCNNRSTRKRDINYFKEKFLERGLKITSRKYINEMTKLKFKCLKCNQYGEMRPSDFLKGYGCSYCAGNRKKTIKEIKDFIEKDNEYEIISTENYKNVHSPLLIKHKCGLIFKMSYNNFRNGQRCPLCSKKSSSGGLSKPVINICNFLIRNNINFYREKTFENFRSEKRLYRYDFYFKEKNVIVEYYGKQHEIYEKNGYFTKEKVEKIKKDDKIKELYAREHNINFEIIWYYEDEIEKIEEIIKRYSLNSNENLE